MKHITWAVVNKETKEKKLRAWAASDFQCEHVDCYWAIESGMTYESLWCDDCGQYVVINDEAVNVRQ